MSGGKQFVRFVWCRDHFRDLARVRALPVQLENGRKERWNGRLERFLRRKKIDRHPLALELGAAGFHFAILPLFAFHLTVPVCVVRNVKRSVCVCVADRRRRTIPEPSGPHFWA